MLSVALAGRAGAERIGRCGGRVSVAAVNGPRAVVVSGEPEALDELLAACEREGSGRDGSRSTTPRTPPRSRRSRRIARRSCAPIDPRAADPVLLDGERRAARHRAARRRLLVPQPARERASSGRRYGALAENGADASSRSSPHPVLTMAVEETIEALGAVGRRQGGRLAAPRRGRPRTVRDIAGRGACGGVRGRLGRVLRGRGARRVDLPTYAFQRERYWVCPGSGAGDVAAAGLGRLGHPVLAAVVRVGDRDEWVFTGRLSAQGQRWVADHAVFGVMVVPGAALVELVLAAGGHVGAPEAEELVLQSPLILPDGAAVQMQVTVGAAGDDGRREVAVYSSAETSPDPDGGDGGEAVCHARGTLAAQGEPLAGLGGVWPPAGAEPVDVAGLYTGLAEAGYDYGPLFQGVRAAWRAGGDVFTEVALPEGAGGEGFGIHPALFDAALHGGLLGKAAGSAAELPFSWSGVRLGQHGRDTGAGPDQPGR